MSSDVPFPHEQTISSDRGFDGRHVHVRVDRVLLPSGREGVREVVEHPGAVAVLALSTSGDVILVRQWRHAVNEALLEVPAGTREPGEPAGEIARRELIEETGYEAETLSLVATFYSSAGYCNEELSLFLAESCNPVARRIDPDERTEVVLVPRNEIDRLLVPGPDQVRDAKTLIALLWLSTPR